MFANYVIAENKFSGLWENRFFLNEDALNRVKIADELNEKFAISVEKLNSGKSNTQPEYCVVIKDKKSGNEVKKFKLDQKSAYAPELSSNNFEFIIKYNKDRALEIGDIEILDKNKNNSVIAKCEADFLLESKFYRDLALKKIGSDTPWEENFGKEFKEVLEIFEKDNTTTATKREYLNKLKRKWNTGYTFGDVTNENLPLATKETESKKDSENNKKAEQKSENIDLIDLEDDSWKSNNNSINFDDYDDFSHGDKSNNNERQKYNNISDGQQKKIEKLQKGLEEAYKK